MFKYVILFTFAACEMCNSCENEICATDLAAANVKLMTISNTCRNIVGNSFYIEARMSAINDGVKMGLTYDESANAVSNIEEKINSAATTNIKIAADDCIKLIGDYKIEVNRIRSAMN